MKAENDLENIYLIYKHTNKINGKIYVGQTGQSPEDRWKNGYGYKESYIDENGNKKYSHFFNAIQKYGWDNFEHKVLIHGLTKEQADIWEKKLIKVWDLMNRDKGYNKKEGGSRGKLSDEAKQKLSKIHKEKYKNGESIPFFKNKKLTEKHKFNLSIARKRGFKNGTLTTWNKNIEGLYITGEKNPMYGKHHTEETRKKMSYKKRELYNGIKNPNATKVIRIRDNKIYNLIKDCAKDNDISTQTITRHCNNKVKNKKFMYYSDYLNSNIDNI